MHETAFGFYFLFRDCALGCARAGCVLLVFSSSGVVFIFFLILGMGFFASSSAIDPAVFSFFFSSPGWTSTVFVFFIIIVRSPYHTYVCTFFLFLYLPLVWFFDPWYYLPMSLLFYQNALLTNPLNYIHPVLVMSSTTYLFSSCVRLTGLFFSRQLFTVYLYSYFFHSRFTPYYLFIAGAALVLGCFWALQLSTWGGWWVWENSELVLLFLFFLLVVLLHAYFVIFEFFLINSLAVFLIIQYVATWLFVFWWNPTSLHTFSIISVFFFHHYFAATAFLFFVDIFIDRRIRTVPYLFFLGPLTPVLLLSCWASLWFSWAPFLGGGFLIIVAFVCMQTRVFRSYAILVGHLLFLVFFILVFFFTFSSYALIIAWLFASDLVPFFCFLGAGVTNLCSLLYFQTEPTYVDSARYLPLTRLVFSLYSQYNTLAFLDPIFVFLCVFVMYFYG